MSTGMGALVRLEWHRVSGIAALMGPGLLALLLLAAAVPLLRDFVLVTTFVYPLLCGLLLGAGVVADDAQQGTLVPILALPISRDRLWLTRVAARLAVLVLLLLLWCLVPWVLRVWEVALPDELEGVWLGLLAIPGLQGFALALVGSRLTRNSFEAAMFAGVAALVSWALIRNTGTDLRLLAGMAVVVPASCGAARDLFLRREPPGSGPLWRRAGAWLGSAAVVLVLIDWLR